jgi:hypothetical protein
MEVKRLKAIWLEANASATTNFLFYSLLKEAPFQALSEKLTALKQA